MKAEIRDLSFMYILQSLRNLQNIQLLTSVSRFYFRRKHVFGLA